MAGIDRLYVYSSTQKYGCLLHVGTVLDMEDKKHNPYYEVYMLMGGVPSE